MVDHIAHAPDGSAFPDGFPGVVYRFRGRSTPLRRSPVRWEERLSAIGSPHHMGAEQAKCQMCGAAGDHDGRARRVSPNMGSAREEGKIRAGQERRPGALTCRVLFRKGTARAGKVWARGAEGGWG